MNDQMPWDSLAIPQLGKLTRRKVESDKSFEVFWVLDEAGDKGLLIQVDDTIDAEKILKSQLKLKGISFSLIDDEKRRVLVKLQKNEYTIIFYKLCLDLCEIVYACKSDKQIFPALKNRIGSWKKLLANSNGNLLSDIEKQGLFAELKFLELCLKKQVWAESEVIDSWKGPEKAQHDFVMGEQAVEIKSITNSSRNKVSISSQDQLFTRLSRLFLRVNFLTLHKDGRTGENLNLLVGSIHKLIEDGAARERFDSKLLESKYIDITENNLPSFTVKEVTDFEVTKDFARIIPSDLMDGVFDVRYKIDLAGVERFKVEEECIWGEYE